MTDATEVKIEHLSYMVLHDGDRIIGVDSLIQTRNGKHRRKYWRLGEMKGAVAIKAISAFLKTKKQKTIFERIETK